MKIVTYDFSLFSTKKKSWNFQSIIIYLKNINVCNICFLKNEFLSFFLKKYYEFIMATSAEKINKIDKTS